MKLRLWFVKVWSTVARWRDRFTRRQVDVLTDSSCTEVGEPIGAPVIVKDQPTVKKTKSKVKTAKETRSKKRERPSESLGALLESIDRTFAGVSCRAWNSSFTSAETLKALKNLGPYVPLFRLGRGRYYRDDPHITIKHALLPANVQDYPSLIFVSPGMEAAKSVKDGMVSPDMLYAIKMKDLPWQVEKGRGVLYEAGAAYKTGGKYFWLGFFVSIDRDTGLVSVLRQVCDRPVDVGVYRYTQRVLAPSQYANDIVGGDLTVLFTACFSFWSERDSLWTIAVKNGNQRATFCVHPKDAKSYFRDREKTVLTSSGKRRPIIHLVSEHTREIADDRKVVVKEHIRGERRFDWRGHSISVTSPLHTWRADTFNVSALGQELDEPIPSGMVTIDQVGAMLAEMEDSQNPKVLH